jgi:hypothetical protein
MSEGACGSKDVEKNVTLTLMRKVRVPDNSPEYLIVLPHHGPIGADFWKSAVCSLNPGQLNC